MEEKIWLYSQLPPAARRDLEQYVEAHPEMQALLEEAKAFDVLLQEAQVLTADPPGDEALAYYLLARSLSGHPAPAPLQRVFDRLEARLQTDPALQARVERIDRRIASLEARGDAVAHFERLSGHRLSDAPLRAAGEAAPATHPAPDRPPAARRAPVRVLYPFRRAAWRAVAAVLACLALYGSLWTVSDLTTPAVYRLAAFEAEDVEADAFRERSAPSRPAPPSSDDLYREALSLLHGARTTTLGLFPRYDEARLGGAAGLLERVAAQEADGSPLQLEAYYLLGKIRLLQRDVPGARVVLREVVARSDWRKEEATRLLEASAALSERED